MRGKREIKKPLSERLWVIKTIIDVLASIANIVLLIYELLKG